MIDKCKDWKRHVIKFEISWFPTKIGQQTVKVFDDVISKLSYVLALCIGFHDGDEYSYGSGSQKYKHEDD